MMGKPAHLGGEAKLAMGHLAEIAFAQQHALRHILPVDQPDLDLGIVVIAGAQLRLAQALGLSALATSRLSTASPSAVSMSLPVKPACAS